MSDVTQLDRVLTAFQTDAVEKAVDGLSADKKTQRKLEVDDRMAQARKEHAAEKRELRKAMSMQPPLATQDDIDKCSEFFNRRIENLEKLMAQ